jgi:hypothetical protein
VSVQLQAAPHEAVFINNQADCELSEAPYAACDRANVLTFSYTHPKLVSMQNGHAAGSDSRCVGVGSARLIWMKHSVQIGWSQHRVWTMLEG